MGYTREQRAANAAKKATAAAQSAPAKASGDLPSSPPRKPLNEPIPPRGNPRDAVYAEIENLHNERSGNEPPEAEPTPAAEPAPEPSAPEAVQAVAEPAIEPVEAVEAAPVAATPAAPAIPTTRQVVDGKEYEVAQTEIDEAGGPTAWRKGKAADNRLAEAKEAIAESKRLQAAAVQFAQGLAQQRPPQPTQQQVDYQQFLHNRMEYIRQGTPEQATQALQEILVRSIPQQVNADQLRAGAVLDFKRQTAVDAFRDEFPEVSANPALNTFASALENQKLADLQRNGTFSDLQQMQAFDWKRFYRMIGNEIRGATARPSQPPATPAAAIPTPSHPSGPSEKEVRKASILNLPTAAAARAEPPKEDKPETREEVLNSMRKKRGLPTV